MMKTLRMIDPAHVRDRMSRIDPSLRSRVLSVMAALDRRDNFPNQRWYRLVLTEKGQPIGYICGFGRNVSTIYKLEWTPEGVRI